MMIVRAFQNGNVFLCNRYNLSGKPAQINVFFVGLKIKQTILFLLLKYGPNA